MVHRRSIKLFMAAHSLKAIVVRKQDEAEPGAAGANRAWNRSAWREKKTARTVKLFVPGGQ
jgi:glycine/D-amino acid oxidase-like deaminating enzyme